MSQESFLGSLPSFSKTAFSQTTPQLQYKQVRRIKERGAKKDDGSSLAVEECRPTITRQPAFPNARNVLLINGVDPDCKYKENYKSTNFPLPFIYSDNFIVPGPVVDSAASKPQPAPVAVQKPSSSIEQVRERKRPKRESERVEVDMEVKSERKRPKRDAERRAEALARQEKH